MDPKEPRKPLFAAAVGSQGGGDRGTAPSSSSASAPAATSGGASSWLRAGSSFPGLPPSAFPPALPESGSSPSSRQQDRTQMVEYTHTGGKKKRQQGEGPTGSDDEDERERGRHSKRSKKKDKHRDKEEKKKKKKKDKDKDRRGRSQAQAPSLALINYQDMPQALSGAKAKAEEGTWTVDRGGDKSVVQYGALYSHDVPYFHRPRSEVALLSSLIGKTSLTPTQSNAVTTTLLQKLEGLGGKSQGKDKKKKKQQQDSSLVSLRYWHSKNSTERDRHRRRINLALSHKRRDRLSSQGKEQQDSGTALGFIPLGQDPQHMQEEEEGSRVSEAELHERQILARTKELSEATRLHPTEASLWIDYLDFQAQAVPLLMGGGGVVVDEGSGVVRAAIRDKQLAILQQALTHLPQHHTLLQRQLRLCEESNAPPEQMEQLWQDTITAATPTLQQQQQLSVWSLCRLCEVWLGYVQSKRWGAGAFSRFSLGATRELYATALTAITTPLTRLDPPAPPPAAPRAPASGVGALSLRERGFHVYSHSSSLLQQAPAPAPLPPPSSLPSASASGGNGCVGVVEERLCYTLILDYCLLEQAAGHEERGVGLMQALLDLTLTPTHKHTQGGNVVMLLGLLERYWEDEHPRLGHEGEDVGFAAWLKTHGNTPPPPPPPPLPSLPPPPPPLPPSSVPRAEEALLAMVEATVEDITRRHETQRHQEHPSPPPSPSHSGSDRDESNSESESERESGGSSSSSSSGESSGSESDDGPKPLQPQHKGKGRGRGRGKDKGKGRDQEDKTRNNKAAAPRPDNTKGGGDDLRALLEEVMGAKGMADLALGEGLVLRADGSVYSTKHGYRIEVSEDMLVSLLLTQQQQQGGQASETYRRILSEVRHETGADERESRYAGMEEVATIAEAIRRRVARRRAEAEAARQQEDAVLQGVDAWSDVWLAWAKQERAAQAAVCGPLLASLEPEKAEAYPEGVVFFDDLRGLLCGVGVLRSERGKRALVLTALTVLGVECVRCSPSSSPLHVLPSLHAPSLSHCPALPLLAHPLTQALHPPSKPTSTPTPTAPWTGGLPEVPTGIGWKAVLQAMFTGAHRDVSVRVMSDSGPRQLMRERTLLSLTTLLQAQPSLSPLATLVSEVAVLVVGGRGGKKGLETVKQRLLKQQGAPALGLYRAFVEAQAWNGQRKEATHVAQAAAAMGNAKMQGWVGLLWELWRLQMAEALHSQGDGESVTRAVHTLACLAEGAYVPLASGSSGKKKAKAHTNAMDPTQAKAPLRLLRARKALEGGLGRAQADTTLAQQVCEASGSVDGTLLVVYEAMALAWLLYLCPPTPSPCPLAQALAPLQRVLSLLSVGEGEGEEWGPKAVGQERIYRCVLELCVCDAVWSGWPKLSLTRQWAHEALTHFPPNPLFMQVACVAERGNGLKRAIHTHVTLPHRCLWWLVGGCSGSVLGWVMVLAHEADRAIAQGATQHNTHGLLGDGGVAMLRRTFEKALANGYARHSGLLWRLYCRLELTTRHYAKAKKVFYRGLYACPSSKGLCLDAFTALRVLFSPSELQDLTQIMTAKDMAIRTDTP